jgi:hypothetical protein
MGRDYDKILMQLKMLFQAEDMSRTTGKTFGIQTQYDGITLRNDEFTFRYF